MKAKQIHEWDVNPKQAREIQEQLHERVSMRDEFDTIETVAGVDIGLKQDIAKAAVVILSYPDMQPLEQVLVEEPLNFPYIPGLLSFRETPSILSAFEKVEREPDLVLTDGQGLAHPRRFGIACHLGVLLDLPAIGCAKSRLYGRHEMPEEEAGSHEWLYDKGGDILGAALRTRNKVKHIYVSIGHKISLDSALEVVLTCCRGYRLPEPTRLAHKVAAGAVVVEKSESGEESEPGDQLSLF